MPRTLFACLVCLFPAVALSQDPSGNSAVGAAGALDDVFSSWQRTQGDIKSLAVDFTFTVSDRVFQTTKKADGIFRMVRTPDGALRASCAWTWEKPNGPSFKGGLLDSRTVYFLSEDREKIVYRLKLGDHDPVEFLADYFNPLTVLLDRDRAEQTCELKVERSEFYTYLHVQPKRRKEKFRWFFPLDFIQGRVTFANVDSESIPRGMPRQLWYCISDGNEAVSDIKSWRMNAADGPTVEDLDQAVKLPGWKVENVDWQAIGRGK